ncbi:MAG: hypothetical protein CL827_03205 [Crocinitomicaceae bacterium]|nr:hypothetical protein [Crocinitomicaceae bacterium]|tara:strand:+ start:3852 stop:4052 length:201 start_codon:yes stop_codon:yes gene_type:complete
MDNHKKILLYSNLVLQMGLIITAGVFFGNYLDKLTRSSIPFWTVILSLFSLIIAFYQVFKNLKNND